MGDNDLTVTVEINDTFAKTDSELEISKKVEPEKPINAALRR
jgi:hypothetical protein